MVEKGNRVIEQAGRSAELHDSLAFTTHTTAADSFSLSLFFQSKAVQIYHFLLLSSSNIWP